MKAKNAKANNVTRSEIEKDLLDYFADTEPLSSKELEELEVAGKELDSDPEFVTDFLKGFFVERILAAMEEEGVSQSELASRLDKSRQYLHGILMQNRRVNFTIDTMVNISLALGRRLYIEVLSQGEVAHVMRTVTRSERFSPVEETLAERRISRVTPLRGSFAKSTAPIDMRAGAHDDRARVCA